MKQAIIKCFFDASNIIGKNEEIINQKIISYLNQSGCNVVQSIIGTDLPFIEIYGKKAASNIYNSRLKDISECDVFVCELSSPSPTVFFEIFEALSQKKPVLVLYSEQTLKSPDVTLLGNPSTLLHLESYNNSNLESKITNFVKKAKIKIPLNRFTIRLTQEADNYLNFLKAKMHCSSKNDVILKLLEKNIAEDTSFQG